MRPSAALDAANADLVRARDEFGRQKSLIDEGFTTRVQLRPGTRGVPAPPRPQVKSATRAGRAWRRDLVGYTELKPMRPARWWRAAPSPARWCRPASMIVRIARESGRDAVFDVPAQVDATAPPPTPSIDVALTNDPAVAPPAGCARSRRRPTR